MGGQPVQGLQPVEEGDLQPALGLADFGDVVEIHLLQGRGFVLSGEHQPDGIGDRAEGQPAVALLRGGGEAFAAQGGFHLPQVVLGQGRLQKEEGFLPFFGRPEAAVGGSLGIAREGEPVAEKLLPGVQIIWYLLHIETTPFTNTAKSTLFCS